jgi:hypothetical protein
MAQLYPKYLTILFLYPSLHIFHPQINFIVSLSMNAICRNKNKNQESLYRIINLKMMKQSLGNIVYLSLKGLLFIYKYFPLNQCGRPKVFDIDFLIIKPGNAFNLFDRDCRRVEDGHTIRTVGKPCKMAIIHFIDDCYVE